MLIINTHRITRPLKSQKAFTLIELMIGIVIGLIMLAATVALFTTMLRSNNDNLKAIHLNQELRAAMSLMSRDIRRAGANRNAAVRFTGPTVPTPLNLFSVAGTTRLNIAPNFQGVANACVTYSYEDDDTLPADNPANAFGYRLDSTNGAIESRAGGAACTESSWEDLTDRHSIEITDLTFTFNTISENNVAIRYITITLTGELTSDTAVSRTLEETIKVRNDD